MELALDYRIYKTYRVLEKIGKGVYGEVFKAVEKGSGKPVAIKKILEAFQNLTDAKRTYRQLGYLLQLHHPSIIRLHRVIVGEDNKPHTNTPRNVYAIFELMNLDLAKTMQLCRLEPLQRKYISLQLVSALHFLHQSDLIHRDIKPSNILLDESCTAKICDFGLVRRAGDFHRQTNEEQIFTEYVASKWYRAPEVMLNGNHVSSKSIDMWSLGCVAAEMILGTSLFTGNSMIEQLERMFQIIGMPNQSEIESLSSEESKFLLRNFKKLKKKCFSELFVDVPSEEISFIESLLIFDSTKRLTASQALQHSYFDELENMKDQFKGIPVKISDFSEQNHSATLQDYCQLIQSLCVQTQRTNKSRESMTSNGSNGQKEYLMNYEKLDFMPEKSTRSSNGGLRGGNHPKYSSVVSKKREEEVEEFYRMSRKPESYSSLLLHQDSNASSKVNLRPKSKVSHHKNRSKSRQSQEKQRKMNKSSKNSLHSFNRSQKSRQPLQITKSKPKTKVFRPNSEANIHKPSFLTNTLTKIPKKKKKQ